MNNFKFMKDEKCEDYIARRLAYIDFKGSSYTTKLVKEYRVTRDQNTLNEILDQTSKLVYGIALHRHKRYKIYDISDLYQEGMNGILKAIEKYNVDGTAQFSTYAVQWIKAYIYRFARDNDFVYTISDVMAVKLNRYFKYIEKHKDDYDRKKASKELNIRESSLITFEKILPASVYLDVPVSENDSNFTYMYDVLLEQSNNVDNHMNLMISMDISEGIQKLVKEALSDREYEVISKRYNFDNENKEYENRTIPYREVASELNVSYQRIQQIESRAKIKIYQYMNNKNIQFEELICI